MTYSGLSCGVAALAAILARSAAGPPPEPDDTCEVEVEDLPVPARSHHRLELSGGYLRNIALAAAFLAADEGAPVAMKHVLHAARREYQKMGKVLDAGRLAYAGVRGCAS